MHALSTAEITAFLESNDHDTQPDLLSRYVAR